MMRPAYRDRCFASKASGGVPERPKGADCKSAVTDFEGSNPSPTTILVCPPSIKSNLKVPHHSLPGGMRSFDKVRVSRSETTRFSAARRVSRTATNNPSPTTILVCPPVLNQTPNPLYLTDLSFINSPNPLAHPQLELRPTIRYTTDFFNAVRKKVHA